MCPEIQKSETQKHDICIQNRFANMIFTDKCLFVLLGLYKNMSGCLTYNLYPVLTVLAVLTADTVETVETVETAVTEETVETVKTIETVKRLYWL